MSCLAKPIGSMGRRFSEQGPREGKEKKICRKEAIGSIVPEKDT
jgi:hypothetical protein